MSCTCKRMLALHDLNVRSCHMASVYRTLRLLPVEPTLTAIGTDLSMLSQALPIQA